MMASQIGDATSLGAKNGVPVTAPLEWAAKFGSRDPECVDPCQSEGPSQFRIADFDHDQHPAPRLAQTPALGTTPFTEMNDDFA
jgi:hypothetical protein